MKNSSGNGASLNFLCIPLGEGSCSIGGMGKCVYEASKGETMLRHSGSFLLPIHSLFFLQVTLLPQCSYNWAGSLRGVRKAIRIPEKIPNLLQPLCYFLVPHNSIAQEGLFGLPSNGKHDLELPRAVPSSAT